MARVRIDEVGQGQHPSEVMVSVKTSNGSETLIVDRRSVVNNSLDIGYPVGGADGLLLVELPREMMRGEWRVFVPAGSNIEGKVTA
jgi:hypothetical protein